MEQEKGKRRGAGFEGLLLLIKVLLIALILSALFGLILGIARCEGEDMSPAVKDGDLVIFYRLQREYHTGDVVVFQWEGKTRLLRIVAMEGDTVDITEEGLSVNGYLQQESEIYEETLPYKEGISFPVTLKAGEVFVLGDGRENAKDSRLYGPIDEGEIKGGVITVLRHRGI